MRELTHRFEIHRPRRAGWFRVAVVVTLVASAAAANATASAAGPTSAPGRSGSWEATAYRGSVHVVRGPEDGGQQLSGTVFDDRNRNSVQDGRERGIGGVTVSNGREVVTTEADGRYSLPAFENMTAFVTQPRGYQVPVDEDNVAQFFYTHLPKGSPKLKYGGIAPTGALPTAVNFPLVKSGATQSTAQSCAMLADVQTYNLKEVEFARAGVFSDLAKRSDYDGCGALLLGDIVGDDLSLFDSTRELTGMLNGPARFLPGNHDLDFDALDGVHEFDTYRSQFGPEYYSYDTGRAHVVALSTIQYPTRIPATKSAYTYGLGEQQLEWLRRDLARVPKNKAIVLAGHSPLLEFFYSDSHTTKEVREIHELFEGRTVTSLGGHTHMSENLRSGDLMKGWRDEVGDAGLPFTHLTVPAVSGHWYSGRVLPAGYPTSIQRDGTPPGVLTLDITNSRVRERFTPTGGDDSRQLAVGLNTPAYRSWYAANVNKPRGTASPLQSPLKVSRADLATTWLTSNFWMGSTGSTVTVALDGRAPVKAERTQELRGESVKVGAEWSDPVAIQEQFVHGGGLADRSMHLWRLPVPTDLGAGTHTATVTATDVHGRRFTETVRFEVVD